MPQALVGEMVENTVHRRQEGNTSGDLKVIAS